MPFFPNFFLRDLVGWLCALGVLAALAAYFPAELGKKADPFQPAPTGIKPEWYFMAMFQTLQIAAGPYSRHRGRASRCARIRFGGPGAGSVCHSWTAEPHQESGAVGQRLSVSR